MLVLHAMLVVAIVRYQLSFARLDLVLHGFTASYILTEVSLVEVVTAALQLDGA